VKEGRKEGRMAEKKMQEGWKIKERKKDMKEGR
jgi:hypothetical protein